MARTFAIKSVISVVDKFTGPLSGINNKIKEFQKPFIKLHNSARALYKELGVPKIGKGWSNLTSKIRGVGSEFANLGKSISIATGAASAALGVLVYSTANAADAAAKTAQKVGVSTESWTKLAYAADMSGISTSTLQSGMSRLNKGIVEAAAGTGEAGKIFNYLGISIKDQEGKLKSAESMMLEVTDRLAEMEDGSLKSSIAMGIFGRSAGPEMIPFLNTGRDGIAALMAEAESLGIVITDEQGKAAESFNDSLARVKFAVKGVTFAIGNQLIPVLEPVIQWVQKWIESNREFVRVKVAEWIERIQKNIPLITEKAQELWKKIEGLRDKILELVERFGGWESVLKKVAIGIAAVKLAPLASAILAVIPAVLSLGSAFALTGYKLYFLFFGKMKAVEGEQGKTLRTIFVDSFKKVFPQASQAARSFAKNLFDKLPGAAESAGRAIGTSVRSIGLGFKSIVMKSVQLGAAIYAKLIPALSGMATSLYAGAAAAGKFTLALLTNPITLIIAGIVALGAAIYLCVKHWDKIKEAVSSAWNHIKSVFVSGWNLLPGWVQEPILKVVDAVAAFGQKVWSGVKKDWERIAGAFSAVWDGIVDAAKAFGAALSDAFSAAWEAISGLFDDKFAVISNAFENSFIGGLLEIARQFNPLTIFIDAFTKVKDWLMQFDMMLAGAELARKLGDGILDALSGIGEKIASTIVSFVPGGESIANAASSAANAVSGVAAGAWGKVKGLVGGGAAEALPAFASGGIVTRPQLAMVGETGPEAIIPLNHSARALELFGKTAEALGIPGKFSGASNPKIAGQAPKSPGASSSSGMERGTNGGAFMGRWNTVGRTVRSETVRDANVTVEFINAPKNMSVKTDGGVQAKKQGGSFGDVYSGMRMGY